MNLLKIGQKVAGVFLATAVFGGSAMAQVPMQQQSQSSQQEKSYSDEDLESFVVVQKEIQVMQEASKAEMQKMLKEEGLDQATFQKMSMKQMQARGQEPDMSEFSQDDQAKFKKIMTAMQEKQQGQMVKVQKVVKAEGMDMMEFQQMAQAIQSDPALQKRLQSMMTEESAE